MSHSILALFLSSTFGVSLLITILLLFRPLFYRFLSANVIYRLWLSIPFYLLFSIAWQEFDGAESSMAFFPTLESTWSPSTMVTNAVDNNSASLLLSIWLTGVMAFILRRMVQYRRLKQSFTRVDSSQYLFPGGIQLPKNLQVVNTALVDFPAVFGFKNNYLILPTAFAKLPALNQQLILKHELFHIRRKDIQINAVRHLFKSLFWFNPLVFLADKYLEADQEISCDHGVLETACNEERKNYALALLESLSGLHRNDLVSQWKFQSLVKERIKMLKNTQVKKWHSWMAGGFALLSVWGTSGLVLAEKQKWEPVPIEIVEPRYPREAVDKSLEGFVQFEFNLDSQGYPYEIKVVDAEPELMFRDSALKALRQWRFKNDKAQTGLKYTMEFKIQ